MYIPEVRDRVRVDGHDEVFVVVHVDKDDQVADLACIERVGHLARVPLAQIHPASEEGGAKG